MPAYQRRGPKKTVLEHFSGKRKAVRRQRSLTIECRGTLGLFEARTVDLSRGGMLIEVTDPAVVSPSANGGVLPFAERLLARFPEDMEVVFGHGALSVRATVVRLETRAVGRAPGLLLGCRFLKPLTEADCAALGLDP